MIENVRMPDGRKVGWLSSYGKQVEGLSMHDRGGGMPFRQYLSREAAIAAMIADAEAYDAHRAATKVRRSLGTRHRGHGGKHLREYGE